MRLQIACTIALACFPILAIAQDSLFLDKYQMETNDRNEAYYFQLKPIGKVDSSNYETVVYHMDGQKKRESKFKNKKIIKEQSYYESGQLQSDIDYENGEFKKIVSYYKLGQIKRTDIFEKGKLIDGKCFNSRGEIIAHTDYEIMPEFPGGENGLMNYIMQNLKYPKEALLQNTQGRVSVLFYINVSGEVQKARVKDSISKELDAEALRIITSMPKWKPGMQDGAPVGVSYLLPITFQMD